MLRCTPQKDSDLRGQISGNTSRRLPDERDAERVRATLHLEAGCRLEQQWRNKEGKINSIIFLSIQRGVSVRKDIGSGLRPQVSAAFPLQLQ